MMGMFTHLMCNKQAVDATLHRLLDNALEHRAIVLRDGHENVAKYVSKPVAGAIFNLGYLPGSDHDIITKPNTTIQSIKKLTSAFKNWGDDRARYLSRA